MSTDEAGARPVLETVIDLFRRGMWCVPIIGRAAHPTSPNWPDLRIGKNGEGEIQTCFTGASGCALLVGEPSGVIDVDIDDKWAWDLAPFFLPATSMLSGRPLNPASHWFYQVCDPAMKSIKHLGPNKECLVEIRSTRLCSVIPPSDHRDSKSGHCERRLWYNLDRTVAKVSGTPAPASWKEIVSAVAHLGCATILAKKWPTKGDRHSVSMAAAGLLLINGVSMTDASRIIEQAARHGGDEEAAQRTRDVLSSDQRLSNDPTARMMAANSLSRMIGPEPVGLLLGSLARAYGIIQSPKARALATVPKVTAGTPAPISDHCQSAKTPGSLEAVLEDLAYYRDQRGQKGGYPSHTTDRLCCGVVKNYLMHHGRFITSGDYAYYFDGRRKQLIQMYPEFESMGTLLTVELGINDADKERRFIVDDLRKYALAHGQKAQIRKFSHYDIDTKMLYISIGAGQIVKLDGQTIAQMDNGADGILFMDPGSFSPFALDYGPPQMTFSTLVDGVNFEPHRPGDDISNQRLLFMLWIYSLFFSAFTRSKPLLCFVGEKGSGKTTALRMVLRALMGPLAEVQSLPEKADDLYPSLTDGGLCVLDNVDSFVPWLTSVLAMVVTDFTHKKRKLYTINENVQLPMLAHVAITSRTPKYRQDDIAERAIILNVTRIQKFAPEGQMIDMVDHERGRMMTSLLTDLNHIVMAMRENGPTGEAPKFRMAGWAKFCYTAVSRMSDSQKLTEDLDRAFGFLSVAQDDFTLQDDPLIELLEAYVTRYSDLDQFIDSGKLMDRLKRIATDQSLWFPYKSAISLGMNLKNKREELERGLGFSIEMKKARANKCTYRISKKPQPIAGQPVAAMPVTTNDELPF